MPANGAVYIQTEKVDLNEVFDNVKSDKKLFQKPTYYDVNLNGDTVRFNVLKSTDIPKHINGFLGYISSLDQDVMRIEKTKEVISNTKTVISLVSEKEFEDNHAIWQSLFAIADKYDGYVFVYDSLLLPSGSVLVGPLLEENIREKNLKILSQEGYIVSASLPVNNCKGGSLRPFDEIIKRLFSLQSILFWVIQDDETTSSEKILSYIERNDLRRFMTIEELDILNLDRKVANNIHASTIGWKFENMWALAWVLGFHIKPEFNKGQIDDEVIKILIYEFLPAFNFNIDYMEKYSKRTYLEVFELEDLFYCAHNSVRNAQLGKDTIPQDKDITIYAGVIQEKRHSLTWCLSPGIAWNETDLST